MVLFPAVPADRSPAVFRSVFLSLTNVDGVDYVGVKQDDGESVNIWIDKKLISNTDSYNAVLCAISAAPARSGYLTSTLQPTECIHGASIGLSVAVELTAPGSFSNVAFTGFVTNLSENAVTNVIHDVDAVDCKVAGALRHGIRLIVPSDSINIARKFVEPYTPKDLVNGKTPRSFIGTALTLLESIVIARELEKI